MTCITVKKEKWFIHLCWDSEVSHWSLWNKTSNSYGNTIKDYCKLQHINDIYFWHSGRLEDALVFKEYCKTNNPKWDRLDDIESFILWFYKYSKERNSTFNVNNERQIQIIIVYKEKIYFVMNYLIAEVSDYASIWSWMFYAKTAMYLWNTAKQAVMVAKEFAWWVWWKVVELKIPYSI